MWSGRPPPDVNHKPFIPRLQRAEWPVVGWLQGTPVCMLAENKLGLAQVGWDEVPVEVVSGRGPWGKSVIPTRSTFHEIEPSLWRLKQRQWAPGCVVDPRPLAIHTGVYAVPDLLTKPVTRKLN